MKFAIIGCGRIAPNHIYAARDNGLEIVAFCDTDMSAIERLIKTCKDIDLSQAKRYSCYAEMLKCEKIDIAAIATPSGSHAEIAIALLRAKINIIIEKPIALSIADANAIIEAAKENRVVATVCHQNRFNKSVQGIYQGIKAGLIADVGFASAIIHWNRNRDYYTQAPWRGTWKDDGGCLMNQCIHNIDLLLWLVGKKPIEVKGYISNITHPYIESEDIGSATILFEDGSIGIIDGTTMVYPENLEEILSVFAKNATVKLGGKSVNKVEVYRVDGMNADELELFKEKHSDNPPNIYGFGHSPLYKNFVEAIKKNTIPLVTLEDGKLAMEIILAIYKSSKTGAAVKLPLAEFSTLDMRGYFKNGI